MSAEKGTAAPKATAANTSDVIKAAPNNKQVTHLRQSALSGAFTARHCMKLPYVSSRICRIARPTSLATP